MLKMHQLMDALREVKRKGEAQQLQVATTGELDGFQGEFNKCHENVARWCTTHPEHKPLRGWLITSGVLFDKHSVVDTGKEGKLLDVTPRRDDVQSNRPIYREFMAFRGTQEEFDAAPGQVNIIFE